METKRYIKFVNSSTHNTRITYRPESGEILVKIPENENEVNRSNYKKLAELVMEQMPSSVDLTMRGMIEHYNDTLKIRMMDNRRKTFRKSFKIDV